jgi:hypothetical protein
MIQISFLINKKKGEKQDVHRRIYKYAQKDIKLGMV